MVSLLNFYLKNGLAYGVEFSEFIGLFLYPSVTYSHDLCHDVSFYQRFEYFLRF